MQQNRVKKILREGGLALGTHVGGIPDPQIVELIGLAGFDAAFIDMEHTTFDLHDVQGTPATVLDRGASLDDEGDRGGPTLGRLLEGSHTSVHAAAEAFR
jgi:hypothetical protein